MQSTSALYKTIFADANHTVEWKITVNGNDYTGDKIAADAVRPRLTRKLFAGMQPTVGECQAAQFSCAIYEASSAVPRMATVVPAYRLVLGQDVSEWITLGTFYIDTRSVDKASGALMLTCFDRMLVADGAGGASYADLTGFDAWPQSMGAVAAEIASIMGVTIDNRTSIGSGTGYTVDYPNDLSMREVLGYIAAANAGNWCITPANALRLVPLTGGSDSFSVGAAAAGLRTSPALASWSGVEVYWDDEESFSAGDDTSRVLTCDCPWATQETANGVLADLSGSAYQPFGADGAIIDLALELGDMVTVGLPNDTVTGPVFSIDVKCSGIEQADLAAPGEDEIDHEYPYASYVDRSLKRKVGLNQAYYGVTISRQKGIEIERGDGNSYAVFNSDTFEMDALIDGVMQKRIYFDPLTGDYVFAGRLSADAMFTDSLYAELGDVAELTVDRLSTSKKVRLYNLQNTGDDNFLTIQDNYLRLVTGSVVTSGGVAQTEQATNRYGDPLYWQKIPVSINASGYPLDENGVQIYATTEAPTPGEGETLDDYKVMVYQYTELTKTELAFKNESGTYVPQLVMGAGDNNGNSKGYLYKSATELLLQYINSAGNDVSVRLNDDGYVDINKLRRATEMDFRGWDYGYFSEELDGNISCGYLVDFDSQGRPVTIYDSGHACEVIW